MACFSFATPVGKGHSVRLEIESAQIVLQENIVTEYQASLATLVKRGLTQRVAPSVAEPVLSDQYHRHLAHRTAHPVRKVPTPLQLGVTAYVVITTSSRTQLEQLNARCVPQD